jgi:hypothetical protein
VTLARTAGYGINQRTCGCGGADGPFRFDWKQSRQSTGRPCVGRKGTLVTAPHCEQTVRVSGRDPPPPEARFPLHGLHRLGSLRNCCWRKKSCSPAVKTNSLPQSAHTKTLSIKSMQLSPGPPGQTGSTRQLFCFDGLIEGPGRGQSGHYWI